MDGLSDRTAHKKQIKSTQFPQHKTLVPRLAFVKPESSVKTLNVYLDLVANVSATST